MISEHRTARPFLRLLVLALTTLALVASACSSDTSDSAADAPDDLAFRQNITVTCDPNGVDVKTTRHDISNVVVELADGTRIKYDDLDGKRYRVDQANVVTVWVKSGDNFSGDGPGYGERFTCNTAPAPTSTPDVKATSTPRPQPTATTPPRATATPVPPRATATPVPATATPRPQPTATSVPQKPTVANDDNCDGYVGQDIGCNITRNDDPSAEVAACQFVSGQLPPGTSIGFRDHQRHGARCTLEGTPTRTGCYTFTYKLISTSGSSDTATVTACIERTPPTATPAPTPTPAPTVSEPPTQCSGDGNDLRVWPDKNGNYADSYIFYLSDGSVFDLSVATDRGQNWNGYGYQYWTAPIATFLNITDVVAVTNGVRSPRVKCSITQISPIALDIDGSGAIELIDGTFRMELTGDNKPETIDQWFGPTDGILINAEAASANKTGDELFGDLGGAYADGFAKLSVLDTDGDAMVSGSELDGLALWIDADGNTKAQPSEIRDLSDFGIVAISTTHVNFVSSADLSDGSTMYVEDIWFSTVDNGNGNGGGNGN